MGSALGGPIDGLLCEYALLKESAALPIPGHLSFEEAATLPCAGLTAWNCLVEQGGHAAEHLPESNVAAGEAVELAREHERPGHPVQAEHRGMLVEERTRDRTEIAGLRG